MAPAQKDSVVIHQKKQAMSILSFPIRIVNGVGGTGQEGQGKFLLVYAIADLPSKERMSATGAKRWAA